MDCHRSPKLSLDLSLPWVPSSPPASAAAGDEDETKRADDSSELRDYIARLEAELRKIEAFRRELPLSVLILNDAIGRLKEDANGNRKGGSAAARDHCEGLGAKLGNDGVDETDKRNWMSSAQLWSSSSDHSSFLQLKTTDKQQDKQQDKNDDRIWCKYGGVKPSLKDDLYFSEDASATDSDMLALTGAGLSLVPPPVVRALPANEPAAKTLVRGGRQRICGEGFMDQLRRSPPPNQHHAGMFQAGRKQRRCWSPDLHRRFVDALEKLGGSQVATPKQIREVMQVDGLTNDEVKSHLQKYRLHIRKLPNTTMNMSREAFFVGEDSADGLVESNDGSEGQTTKTTKVKAKQSRSPEGPFHLLSVLRPAKSNSAASWSDDNNSLEVTVEEEMRHATAYDDDEEKSEGSHSLSWKGH